MIGVTVLISFISALLIYIYWLQNFSKYAKQINKFPKPISLPIIGNIYLFWKKPEKIFTLTRDLAKKYRSTYALWSVNHGMVNIITADDAEILLSSSKHIEKSMIYDFVSEWLGKGLLTSTGPKWQHRRKLLTPAFHFNILLKFVETFGEHSQKLVEDLRKEINESKTNIIPIISNSALQIICELIVQRTISPWYYNDFIFYLFPIGWQQKRILNILHTFTKNVIKKREANYNETDVIINNNMKDNGEIKKKLAMLDLLISAKKMHGSVDDEGIREEVDTFMFEGHDTTAVALTFAIMLMANHQEYQEKVVEELKEIFGEDSTRPATYDELQKMQYLELCLKESLRLYPSVPFISRVLNEDMPLTKDVVPAGCTVNLHIYDLHRDPKYFPDPEKFDPNRFLPENAKGRHPYSYVPFSAGPRNCIGQKFAMLEMKSIMSAILRNYILEPVSTQESCEIKVDLVLRSNQEIYVTFKPRV